MQAANLISNGDEGGQLDERGQLPVAVRPDGSRPVPQSLGRGLSGAAAAAEEKAAAEQRRAAEAEAAAAASRATLYAMHTRHTSASDEARKRPAMTSATATGVFETGPMVEADWPPTEVGSSDEVGSSAPRRRSAASRQPAVRLEHLPLSKDSQALPSGRR